MRVYFSRAIDGCNVAEETRRGQELALTVQPLGFEVLDPLNLVRHPTGPDVTGEQARATVIRDLELLKTADVVLMDLSLPCHSYIGCICELVYAYLWRIPVVVWVGESGNDRRLWLRHHATFVCGDLEEAVGFLASQRIGREQA